MTLIVVLQAVWTTAVGALLFGIARGAPASAVP